MSVATRVFIVPRVRYWGAVVCLSVAAALLYTHQLGEASFWFDESASFANAGLSWHEFGIAILHRDAFFALYYAVLHCWMWWFGSDEATLRMPSVLGALAALPCMFALGSRMFGMRVGLMAAILLASNGLFVIHLRQARPYPWLVPISLISSLLFLRAIET